MQASINIGGISLSLQKFRAKKIFESKVDAKGFIEFDGYIKPDMLASDNIINAVLKYFPHNEQ